MKKSWITSAIAGIVLLCGNVGAAQADDLQKIIDAKTVRAGICLTSEPAGFRDADNTPKGYDVDVANMLAEQLGVALEIVEVEGSTRIPMLLSDKIDVIICNITATTERAKSVDFSFPYLRTGIRLLVQKDGGITGFQDLAGKKVVVGRGTTGEAMVKQRAPEAELVYIENPGDAILQMRQKKADAYIEDSLGIDWIAKTYPDQLMSLPETYSSDPITLGIRKDNPSFLRWLDLFASTYVSSGRYDETYRKWWGTEAPKLNAVW
ncbi:MAG: transporter substrate-binding domain-containing protein [Devosia sp.]|uniref:transporter substrate-binding domain-containing protein n=1 Tax=Devosia sp. TaxID=1871048 RepID=UPI001A54108B|nr:transporter substrate-binding domain-containing protein [Devosia sp.]MBL8596734.1 transporter substrate-binding domain-containing protein [Devosia sp.]